MRRLLPLVGAFYALLAAHPASAEATGRVFTCHESTTSSWQMTQPQQHADAGLWPRWSDCLAWRNGDPGPTYVWSYGEVSTTTTSSPATTIPETTMPETTVPETTTTLEATTTTVEETTTTSSTTSSTTTTTSSTTTTQPIATSTSTSTTTSIDTPIQTIASTSSTTLPNMSESTRDDDIIPNIENTSTSSSTSTTAPNPPITPETLTPDKPSEARGGLAEGASNGLAPGVTPEAQRAIVAASLGLITSSAAASRRRT